MKSFQIIFFFFILTEISCGYKWLNTVSGSSSYAGEIGTPILAVKIEGNTKFLVHYLNGGWSKESAGGILGDYKTPIDAIAIQGTRYQAYAKGRWQPEVSGYNTNDDNNGYAGVFGYEIEAIKINGMKYSVAITNEVQKNKQILTRGGTGIKGITEQWKVPHMREGCLFMAACAIGGLYNDKQIQDAYHWAVSKGYIRASDTLLYIDGKVLGQYISRNFKTKYNSDWSIKKGCGHYWAVDKNGREVFNASGLGYSGCK